MKKRIMSILLILCMVLSLHMTAYARCPMDVLIGTNEPWGMTRTFVVGDAFDGIGEIYEHKKGGIISHTKNREWWANGVQIKQGDVFKQVGMYEMVMRSGNIVATPYKFDVIPRLDHGWQNVSKLALITPPKTTYRQGADPFDPRDIVVRITFRNGQTQDLHHEDLMIFAGPRGMRSYADGVRVQQGFRFFEAGERDFIVRVVGKELTIPFTVTPFVTAVELTQEPMKGGNRTDTTIRSSDFEVRATFKDGSSQLINGDCLRILGNGNRLFFGGEYDFGVSSVTVNITMGNFSIRRVLHTVAGLNILSFPKKTAYSVGNGFDSTGFNAVINDGGKNINVNDRITFYMDNVQLTQGRAFTTARKNRVVEVRYAGRKVAEYTIHVYDGTVSAQAAPVPAPVKSPAAAVTVPEVKVLNNKEYGGAPYRNKPEGNVLGTIPQGTKVLLLEKRRDGYAWVRWNGMEYYVWAERIEIPTPASTATSSTSPNANATVLESGDYYMKIGDRYIYPAGGDHYWLEVSSDKPDKPFSVKLVNNSADRGPEYTIIYDGRYVYMDTSCPASMQLHSNNVPHSWRINTYSKFSTIRDYKNQALLVNTFGGTVFVSSISGSAPELGRIVFIKD
ncbi:hypothetical protein CS063_06290 [Sporanaerobium hydrogeniformans]|uniref:Uncharacterized protein n=1 Tax=Sporanaerobium hydrogeniformans TaxID=3072179 RepID=A0AC61DDM4_9FIRM|nr:hypothetical protein [Sporanaerobium hydrogeniformans]PHV71296.1 hypothetical protein CS063_06290 [Sporanaerobium hydrogeniformans]